jgi:hypothetical protein
MVITKKQLEDAYEKYKGKYAGNKYDYFAPLYIARKLNIPLENILGNCSYRNNDYGIDAYYINAKNLYLYQFKWPEDPHKFGEDYKRLIEHGVERIFGDPYVDPQPNELILNLKRDINEYRHEIKDVYICFVYNGDAGKAEEDPFLTNLKEDLKAKKYILVEYFEREINLEIRYFSNKDDTKKIDSDFQNQKIHKYNNISFKSPSKKETKNGILYLGFINLYDLYNMYCDMRNRFFERNIRFGLDESTSPNQAIKKSFREIFSEKIDPENFTFHHNGVTIFAEKFELQNPSDNNLANIIEPRILNGAQTITTLFHYVDKEIQTLPNREEKMNMLKKIEVIGKIITKCKDKDFVTQVTISNNKQNPVAAWNLRANDDIQLKFAAKFRTELGINYERQENSSKSYRESELEELGLDKNKPKPIKVTKLAQTFLAFQGNIDKISNVNKIFENEELYKKTFCESYLEADVKKIIIAYKIQFWIKAVMDSIRKKGAKYYFVYNAKDLIWALTIQGFLNCDNADDLLDDYGEDLTKAGVFIENIKTIGSNDIKKILSKFIEEYQEDLENGNFTFLKKKDAFLRCMVIAKKDPGWKTINL